MRKAVTGLKKNLRSSNSETSSWKNKEWEIAKYFNGNSNNNSKDDHKNNMNKK